MDTHKTGFLLQNNGVTKADGTHVPPFESWHRTLKGALKEKDKQGLVGKIYKITGEDSTELVR